MALLNLPKYIKNVKIHHCKKGMSLMAYENYEMDLISSFGYEVEQGIINPNNTDIQGNNARNKYNKYISSIISLNPKEYLTTDFEELGRTRVFEKAFEIIIYIFGNKVIPEALEYFKHLVPSGAKEPLNSICLTKTDTLTGDTTTIVEIPDFKTSSNIVTIVLEFSHYYLNKVGVDFNKKRYYEEIIAILCEKIASQIVELHTCQIDFYDKMTEHRLETISWHYSKNLQEMNSLLEEYAKLEKRAKTDLFDRMRLQQFQTQMPIIRTAKGISALRGYYQNMADGFGIGFLYSESLLERFLDDNFAFQAQLDKLINHEQSLQDLLNYYGINARSNEVYDIANKRIEEIKTFKKR